MSRIRARVAPFRERRREACLHPQYHGRRREMGPQARRRESFFRSRIDSFEAVRCGGREDAIRKTRTALTAGACQVVAVGGDGTANAVANGFFEGGATVRPEASLAVAGVGTGSDYLRALCGPRPVDWREVVLNGHRWRVDLAVVRAADDPQARPIYFLNLAGFGLSARVVARKERIPRWLQRSLRYRLPTLASCPGARPWRVRVEVDGAPIEREVSSVVVGKGVYAGSGMRFGGGVELDDGLLGITVFRPMSLLRMLVRTSRLYRGDLEGDGGIERRRARRVVLRGRPPLPAEGDGELIGSGDVAVTILPRSISVCGVRVRRITPLTSLLSSRAACSLGGSSCPNRRLCSAQPSGRVSTPGRTPGSLPQLRVVGRRLLPCREKGCRFRTETLFPEPTPVSHRDWSVARSNEHMVLDRDRGLRSHTTVRSRPTEPRNSIRTSAPDYANRTDTTTFGGPEYGRRDARRANCYPFCRPSRLSGVRHPDLRNARNQPSRRRKR
jgi:diacylglycerol kinase family enzyme